MNFGIISLLETLELAPILGGVRSVSDILVGESEERVLAGVGWVCGLDNRHDVHSTWIIGKQLDGTDREEVATR